MPVYQCLDFHPLLSSCIVSSFFSVVLEIKIDIIYSLWSTPKFTFICFPSEVINLPLEISSLPGSYHWKTLYTSGFNLLHRETTGDNMNFALVSHACLPLLTKGTLSVQLRFLLHLCPPFKVISYAQRKISASEEFFFPSPHPLSAPGQSQKSWFYVHCQRLLGLSVELRAHWSPFLQWCHLPFWFLALLSDQQISSHIIVVPLEVMFLLCM